MDIIMLIVICVFVLGLCLFGFLCIKMVQEANREREVEAYKAWELKMHRIVEGSESLSPEQFLEIRNSYKGHLQDFDFMGCYVIYNKTKKLYYVGQAKHVPNRVNAHFTGKGNGDVYADYKYGDGFEIHLIDVMTTEYRRLDDLERDLIKAYGAYKNGYNKTHGNR